MNALTRSLRLVVLVATELAAVFALARLGRRTPFVIPVHRLGRWVGTAAPADVLVAVLRVLALGGALWLLLSTLAYAVARAARVPRAVAVAGLLTLPSARRVVDAALAASIAAGSLLGPAVAAGAASARDPVVTSPPGHAGVRDGHSGALASLPPDAAPVAASPASPRSRLSPSPSPGQPQPPQPLAPPAAAIVAVQEGDSLWQLAAARVAEHTGRPVAELTDVEITGYWLTVCDANRARLRSGDPSLIYPGEIITLPPVG